MISFSLGILLAMYIGVLSHYSLDADSDNDDEGPGQRAMALAAIADFDYGSADDSE